MSLMGTLAKVAIGIAVAKGVGGMLKGGSSNAQPQGQGGGGLLGDLLKGATGQSQQQSRDTQIGGQGGLGDLLGGVLGGQKPAGGQTGGVGGGLGDLLEQLGGGMPSGNQQQSGPAGGGLGDLLGQLTGGKVGGAGAGGLGDLLGGLVGGAAKTGAGNGGSFGDILNDSFKQKGEPQVQPTQDQEVVAALMLRAMVQATKADGELDESEKERLLSNLGEVSEQERAFVHQELQAPMDVAGLARQVPQGMEQQIYTMSVMAIDLDSQSEAQYLHQFAEKLGLEQNQVNAIHDQMGVQRLYA